MPDGDIEAPRPAESNDLYEGLREDIRALTEANLKRLAEFDRTFGSNTDRLVQALQTWGDQMASYHRNTATESQPPEQKTSPAPKSGRSGLSASASQAPPGTTGAPPAGLSGGASAPDDITGGQFPGGGRWFDPEAVGGGAQGGMGGIPPVDTGGGGGADLGGGEGGWANRMRQFVANREGSAFAGPYLSQYERAGIRLGQFPGGWGPAQSMFIGSYLAGNKAWSEVKQDPDTGEYTDTRGQPVSLTPEQVKSIQTSPDGQQYVKTGPRWAQASELMGYAGQGFQRAPQILSQIERIPILGGAVQAGILAGTMPLGFLKPQQYLEQGQEAGGYSRTGVGGTPFLSPAAEHGLGMEWRAGLRSWFGFNPNYNFQQAQEAEATIAASGYWGQDAKFLAGRMQSLSQTAKMTPQETMAAFDPLMRFGGAAPSGVSGQLDLLAKSAAAAHLGLTQFNQSLAQAAQQVTDSTGMVAPTGDIMAMSAATGMDPSALTGLYSGHNMIMGAMLSHQRIGDVIFGQQGREKAAMALPEAIWGGLTGHLSFKQFQQLPTPQRKMIKDRLAYAYLSNPQIFGGVSPEAMMNLWARGGKPISQAQALHDLGRDSTEKQFLSTIQEFGGKAAPELRRELLDQVASGKIDFQGDPTKARQDAKELLGNRMSKIMDQQHNRATKQVTLTLDPWARQLLKFKNDGKDNTSSGGSGWRKAMDIGTTVAEDVWKVAHFF